MSVRVSAGDIVYLSIEIIINELRIQRSLPESAETQVSRDPRERFSANLSHIVAPTAIT
jgi:hypothetical protein